MAGAQPREMLFMRQAAEYARSRPTYPKELFSFILRHVPRRLLAWDVGTGNGQCAVTLSESFEKVIATDVCDQQIKHARRRPNISYIVASASMNAAETEKSLGISEGSVDLITSAQAMHWFDLPSFYATAKHVLRPKVGVLAAWTYREPRVSAEVDAVCQEFYDETEPFWDSAVKKIVDDGYKHLPFPFSSCEESTTTGPFEFWGEQQMTYERFLSYLRSWSPYQTAKSKGVELIDSDRAARLLQAWGADTQSVKTIRFPIYLILGRNS